MADLGNALGGPSDRAMTDAALTGSRFLRRLGMSCLGLAILVASFFVLERYYLVHGKHYPAWLATAKLEQVDEDSLKRLRSTECSNTTFEVFYKPAVTVVRCGQVMYGPSTKTFVAPPDRRRPSPPAGANAR